MSPKISMITRQITINVIAIPSSFIVVIIAIVIRRGVGWWGSHGISNISNSPDLDSFSCSEETGGKRKKNQDEGNNANIINNNSLGKTLELIQRSPNLSKAVVGLSVL